jgi:hypothetical protein
LLLFFVTIPLFVTILLLFCYSLCYYDKQDQNKRKQEKTQGAE